MFAPPASRVVKPVSATGATLATPQIRPSSSCPLCVCAGPVEEELSGEDLWALMNPLSFTTLKYF